MIRCMIVEDEPLAWEILSNYIAKLPELELVSSATDGLEALKKFDSDPVDIIFLDVNLPKMSGINFYRSLSEKPQVIFTTAYPEFAVDGFELDAVDYLLKPFSFDRFVQAIEKAKDSAKTREDDILVIKQDKKLFRIPLEHILYIESLRDYVRIHGQSKNWISAETLKKLESKLPQDRFVRIHKSYIVALPHIEYLEGNQIQIRDQKLPIGYSYREKVFEFFGK